jgi:hypothetical protein
MPDVLHDALPLKTTTRWLSETVLLVHPEVRTPSIDTVEASNLAVEPGEHALGPQR